MRLVPIMNIQNNCLGIRGHNTAVKSVSAQELLEVNIIKHSVSSSQHSGASNVDSKLIYPKDTNKNENFSNKNRKLVDDAMRLKQQVNKEDSNTAIIRKNHPITLKHVSHAFLVVKSNLTRDSIVSSECENLKDDT